MGLELLPLLAVLFEVVFGYEVFAEF